VSNFDISASELVMNYNLGDFIPLNMPKLRIDDIKEFIYTRYNLDQNTLDKINVNFPLHNYKERFCNLNEYFYAFGDLISEYNKNKTDYVRFKEKERIGKHIENYLLHSNSASNKFNQLDLSGKI
jgi:hypothetical protein